MKKNSPVQYARALYEVSSQTDDTTAAVQALVELLKRKNTLGQLPAILAEFEKYAAKKEGVVNLSVTSAHTLSTETKKQITSVFGGQATIIETIDERLIGGVVIRTENSIFDGSTKKQLERLKNALVN